MSRALYHLSYGTAPAYSRGPREITGEASDFVGRKCYRVACARAFVLRFFRRCFAIATRFLLFIASGVYGLGVLGMRGGCGGRIRTDDLRVMSPTSCRCSTPRLEVYPRFQWVFGEAEADGDGFGEGLGEGLGLGLGWVVTRYVFSFGLA
jgi:hypothetical protein